jgi:hypothetical protein
MKAKFFLGIILIFLTQFIYSQDNEILSKICSGKWHLEYLEIDGEKEFLTEVEQKNNWVIFYLDGNHEVLEKDEKYFGKWKFFADNKIIQTNDRDGLVDQRLITITDKILVVSVEEHGEVMLIGMKKMQ